MIELNRDILLTMDDHALSGMCEISFCKGSGPGGQKRNKTSSAVQLHLRGTEISAGDCTERSQIRNRSNALKKLKMQIAMKYRLPRTEAPEHMECSMNSDYYALFAAQLLDIIEQCSFDHRKTAEICGISPSALLKKIYRDPLLWQFFQAERKLFGLPELQSPK